MQKIWDMLVQFYLWITSLRSVLVTGFTGAIWFYLDPLLSWAKGAVTSIPGIGPAVGLVKDHLWEGWSAVAGGYWTTQVLEGVHFFIGLGCLHDCADVIVSTAVAVMLWKIGTKLLPGLG